MSGHSKWATIKHKKAALDAKRGKKFTKLIKEITVAARTGGGDPTSNAHLRLLLEKAKQINMPQDNANRAIKRGTGELPGISYERCMYEGYGPHNIAVLVDVLTDNKNKAVAELRHFFSKQNGTFAESGAVSWMFEKQGVLKGPATDITEDELMEQLIDYDVSDITIDDGTYIVYCAPTSLDKIRQVLTQLGRAVEHAELEWVPKNSLSLSDEHAQTAMDFLSGLEDLDDVQNVYTNLE
ncbi:YebC/PmpR family DNA-binding transcriptional regulator [Candidatus Babeliales bacterium]|nr:YebC/PmpR family DNA-binding transcriptional regulator [Candidatus Babeliales bacterium]